MTVSFYLSLITPLSLLLLLLLLICFLHPCTSLGVSSSSSPKSNNNNSNNDYLAPLFKAPYADLVGNLSPTAIVSMMPITTFSSSSSSSFSKPLRQQLFTSPAISTLYERVLPPLWQLGLRIGGPDAEYTSAAPHLEGGDTSSGGIALDLSCGTGFVGRRIAASNKFQHVFCLDYSPQMLGECIQSIQREGRGECDLSISILRGDAGELPFQDGVIDAIHWGAAMHCVPNVEKALDEVYRVLKPGGKLYATTFLRPFPDVIFRFFTIPELKQLSRDAGFDPKDTVVEGRGVYGIIRATKQSK